MPATNRISGPWLQAAGAPMKCRPGTVLSKPLVSLGRPFTRLTRATIVVDRNAYFATSTR